MSKPKKLSRPPSISRTQLAKLDKQMEEKRASQSKDKSPSGAATTATDASLPESSSTVAPPPPPSTSAPRTTSVTGSRPVLVAPSLEGDLDYLDEGSSLLPPPPLPTATEASNPEAKIPTPPSENVRPPITDVPPPPQDLPAVPTGGDPTNATVVYSYTAADGDEIDLVEGQRIEIIFRNDDGWFQGRCYKTPDFSDFVEGLFPGGFITEDQ